MSDFGREMTAEDVKWSIEKGLTDGTGGFWMFVGGMCVGAFGCLDGSGIEVIDDLTVQFTLASNEDKFLPTLGSGWLVIYDSVEVLSHATEEDPSANEWLNQNTAGFGPYRIADFGPGGESVTLEARENYWGQQPALQTVTQRSVPDANTRLQLLLSGDAVYAAELGILALDEVRATDAVTVTEIPTTTGAFLALTFEPPFDDLAVRAAIAQAIPYDDIIDVVFRGGATAWDSLLIPPVPGYDNSGFLGTDLDAARAVLSELDASLTLSYAAGLPVDEEIAILVQSSFREAGFDIQLDKQPRADFDGRKYAKLGELQFFVDTIDVPAFFDAQYYTNLYGGPFGFSNFMNYGSDELNAALGAMLDPATKDQAVADAQAIFARDFPIYPIAWTGLDYAHADYVELNQVVTGNGLLRIQDFVAAG
jgi:peptide/nickel transport system substrate-binding protein